MSTCIQLVVNRYLILLSFANLLSFFNLLKFFSEDECYLIDDVYEVDDDAFEEEEEQQHHSFDDEDDDLSLSNRVINLLQGRCDLQTLSLKACKSYLRRHGLRVSGNKDECVHRIQEHWRIKDGKAESLYPRSSFVVNCTGDVCKGDTVLFEQKVYGSFGKVGRNGKLLGKRTVAGRVVKESYGAAKQQHTFTVEVLWSKGIKKLLPLVPLLVKGRNLYRLKTYRQLWKDEGERRKVLAEKHRRGTIARSNRAKRIKALSTDKGRNSRKIYHCRSSSDMSFPKGHRPFVTKQGASSSTTFCNSEEYNVKQGAQSPKTFPRPQKQGFWHNRVSTVQPYPGSSEKYPKSPHNRSAEFGSHSAEIHNHGRVMMPAAQNDVFSHSSFINSIDIYSPWFRQLDSRQFFPSQMVHGQWNNGFLNCSTRGCSEPGSNGCAIAACWRCCRRVRMGCIVHR